MRSLNITMILLLDMNNSGLNFSYREKQIAFSLEIQFYLITFFSIVSIKLIWLAHFQHHSTISTTIYLGKNDISIRRIISLQTKNLSKIALNTFMRIISWFSDWFSFQIQSWYVYFQSFDSMQLVSFRAQTTLTT